MKFRVALLAAAALTAPLAARAQPVTGPYISLGAGAEYLQNQDVHGDAASIVGSKLKTNIGGIASGAIGYGLGNGLRIEIQGDWSSPKFYDSGSNYIQEYHGFVNALYDLDGAMVGVPWLSPYVGVGGGYGASHLTSFNGSGADAAGQPTFFHSTGTHNDYAVQGIAGLAFSIGSVPGLALTAEYRFTTQPSDANYNAQYLTDCCSSRVKLRTDGLFNHVALLGLRYQIFSPPAPVPPAPPQPLPPAPPPTPTRTYLVFFDWDRADLTERARQIVAEAATASTHVQTTRIEVNGYTDLSGTAAYNQRLSVRRAQSVEAELVRDGVAKGEISIHGFGESNPLVPTAKGVREPQNRRVEIILK
jgi:outer membrane protein OmpA-like peptidoglycan-associated protein